MKFRTIILTSGLFFVGSIGTPLRSDESVDNVDTNEVQRLRNEVKTLRRQVDFLILTLHFDESDIDALTQRVRHAEMVQSRIQARFQTGGAGGSVDQLHRCNAELRLAQARLAFAKKDYDAARKHLDAAVAASKMVQQALQNRFDTGTVTLDFVIAAQQSVTDVQLEKNRIQRMIQFLTAAQETDSTDASPRKPKKARPLADD